MNLENMLAEIQGFCRLNADPQRVQKYERYFKEGYDAYGLQPELMEKQRNTWLAQFGAELGLDGFIDLGSLLVKSGKYEEASFAIRFVAHFSKQYTPQTLERLGGWLDDGICNWAHTDILCGDVLLHFILREITPIEAFSEWRKAPSKWKRRAVPVTLINALKMEIAPERLLAFVEPMMADPERVVHQGLGWFLRETWKKHPAPVEAFLLAWKDRCARLIVQYSTEKMTSEQKARFKKSK